MEQCQSFFDDKSPSICKSTSSGEHPPQPWPPPAEGDAAAAEERSLELRLGSPVDAGKPKLHEMVRPIPRYPSMDRQWSSHHGTAAGSPSPSLFRGQSDSFLGERAFFSKDSAFSTPPLISRDQAWHPLQNVNAAMGSDRSQPRSVDDSASSLLGRRSASMQSLIPLETSDLPYLRRSYSNLTPSNLLSHQSSLGQEALVDESPDPVTPRVDQHQQDAFELQKKKEIQAQRRLEARKRRRLILNKQQKKARQYDVPNMWQQSVSPVEKAPPIRTYSLERKYSVECKPHPEIMAAKLADDENKRGKVLVKVADNCIMPPVLHHCTDRKQDSHGLTDKRHDNASSGCDTGIRGALSNVRQMIASCDLSADSGCKQDNPCEQSRKDVEMFDVSRMLPNSYSETESTESKEKGRYASERESSSNKSSMENRAYHCKSVALASPSSKPIQCLQTSPGANSSPSSSPSVSSKGQMNSFRQRASYVPSQKGCENEAFAASQAPYGKVLNSLGEVPSKFTIKRSVGVFTEGKWKVPVERPNCLPLRRTASNINEGEPEQLSMAKKLEMCAALCASQLKFTGKALKDTVSPIQSTQVHLHLSSKSHLLEKILKKEIDASQSGDMASPHTTAHLKVKEEPYTMEEDISECNAAATRPWTAAPMGESEPIKRQISASFSEFPWVTATGSGPMGRTINGVMYITGDRSVRLVCKCHGRHMTPAEFLEHAGSTDLSNPLRSIVVNAFPMPNHSTSTPV